jgi:hypothetical protein
MKLKEAKQIIGSIIDWQMELMGVVKRTDKHRNIDLPKYSLEDLIKANKAVEASNKRKEKKQKWQMENGVKQRGITIHMILDDRIIAAAYTAMHFNPNGEMIALINDIGVGCVKANYNEETE